MTNRRRPHRRCHHDPAAESAAPAPDRARPAVAAVDRRAVRAQHRAARAADDRRALDLRHRWRRAGWVDGGRLTYTLPSLLWLTAEGAAIANSPYRRWEPNPARAEHLAAITNVRLLLEHELRLGEWRCERGLAQAAGPRYGRAVPPARRAARHGSRPGRDRGRADREGPRHGSTAIVEELAIGHDRVWYFAPEPAARALREVLRTSPWENVTVYPYPVGAADLLA